MCTGTGERRFGAVGNPTFIFRPVIALNGETPVALCGVALNVRRNVGICSFQFLPSAVDALMLVLIVSTKRSAAPFASGHIGVIFSVPEVVLFSEFCKCLTIRGWAIVRFASIRETLASENLI